MSASPAKADAAQMRARSCSAFDGGLRMPKMRIEEGSALTDSGSDD